MKNFQGHIVVGCHRLYCEIHCGLGLQDDPLLVFLHEGLGSIPQWKDFPHELATRSGLPFLIYDRLGHGRSDPLTFPRASDFMQQQASELQLILRTLELSNPLVLIGHSDGGSIALLYAARYPQNVKGAITEAAHVMVEDVTRAGLERAVAAYESGSLRKGLEKYHGSNTDTMFHGWADTWRSPQFQSWDIRQTLHDIKAPVLAIQGSEDEYGTPQQLHEISRHCGAHCELFLVPGCRHIPHLQARQPVVDKMSSFIAEKCL